MLPFPATEEAYSVVALKQHKINEELNYINNHDTKNVQKKVQNNVQKIRPNKIFQVTTMKR